MVTRGERRGTDPFGVEGEEDALPEEDDVYDGGDFEADDDDDEF